MSITIKIGCIAKDTWENLKTILCYADVGKYTSLQMPVGTFYQVGIGKILRTGLVIMQSDINFGRVKVGYGDDTVDNSVTAPTNFVALTCEIGMNTAYIKEECPLYLKIPSGKYPCIYSGNGTSNVVVMGYEEE